MTGASQKAMLKKLLLQGGGKARLWAALAALFAGTFLFLAAVLIQWNFEQLLHGKHSNDALGSTFLVIGKKITDQNMGVAGASVFSEAEIADAGKAPQVEDIGIIASNRFPAYAMMGGNLGFATDLPLESVPDKFLDQLPPGWQWQPGSTDLPIILSTRFMDIYNYVFAPSQNLPQLSENTIKSLALRLKVGGGGQEQVFMAHVVGFSDRIGSVLVPQAFLDYGNATFGNAAFSRAPSQLILKTHDPSDPKFAAYLAAHRYTTNNENLRLSKLRTVVEAVAAGTGILAVLLMGIGTLVVVLFIELTIARAKHSVTLLLQLGYSPKFLGGFLARNFLPTVSGAAFAALAAATLLQFGAAAAAKNQAMELPLVPGWPFWAAFLVSWAILVLLVSKSIKGSVK